VLCNALLRSGKDTGRGKSSPTVKIHSDLSRMGGGARGRRRVAKSRRSQTVKDSRIERGAVGEEGLRARLAEEEGKAKEKNNKGRGRKRRDAGAASAIVHLKLPGQLEKGE